MSITLLIKAKGWLTVILAAVYAGSAILYLYFYIDNQRAKQAPRTV